MNTCLQNGFILALPYIAHTVLLLSTSFLADYLKRSRRLSRTQIRKFAHAFGTRLHCPLFVFSADGAIKVR